MLLVFEMKFETNIKIIIFPIISLGQILRSGITRMWIVDILSALEMYCQIICWKEWSNICSLSFFILLDSFGTYVLGPVPGCRDIVVSKIGKNPCHHKAIYTSRGKQIIRECI